MRALLTLLAALHKSSAGLSVGRDADAMASLKTIYLKKKKKERKSVSVHFLTFSGGFLPMCLSEEVICDRPSAVLSSPEPNFTKSSHFHKQGG